MQRPAARGARDLARGLWRLADPKISLTSVAGIALGAGLAAVHGAVHPGWLAVTLLAFFAMETAKNAWGDVFDFDSGTDLAVAPEDRTPFSGGKRVLVDGLLTRRQTWAIAAVFTGLGLAGGAALVLLREPLVFWPGALGLVLGWSYHGPPLQLAYRGLGELDVVICYGPLVVGSAYLIQTGTLGADVILASLPLGLLIGAFLWVNEFPDYEADRTHGKHNLVVRLGRRRAARVLPAIHAVAFGLLALLPLGGLPPAITLGGLAVVPAVWADVALLRDPEHAHRHTPVQPLSLAAFLVLAAGCTTGLAVAAR
ncbi:MAG: prenyltransferase [Myxococcota bacterium]|nr:prenyltransferase [Myxococcota bacterium]